MPDNIHRIGILTGGGDCPGLNAVIRAVVKTAIYQYVWEVLGIKDSFEGLIQPSKIRPLSLIDVRGISLRGDTNQGTTNRADPFNYEIETETGIKVFDLSDDVIRHAQVLGLDTLIVIGGDGSLHIATELMQKGLRVVGIPKTIDNDIQETDVTFGFDITLNTVTEALNKLHTTAESHHRVIILEVMSRNTGWITLQAVIAGGADVILIPEIPYHLEIIAEKIERRNRREANFSLIVVAEGARPMNGEAIYQAERDIDGAPRLGCIGDVLAHQLRECYDVNVRVTVLCHLQRGGSPTAFDRLLAPRFATMAVHLVAEGKLGYMVALQGGYIVTVPLQQSNACQKLVPFNSDVILTALGLDICLGEVPQKIISQAVN